MMKMLCRTLLLLCTLPQFSIGYRQFSGMKAEFKVREEDKNKGYIYFMTIRQSGEMPRYQSPSAIPFLLGHRDRVSDWVELQGSALTLSPSLVFAVSGRRDVDRKQTDCHILNNSETKTNTSAVCLCVCVCVCV